MAGRKSKYTPEMVAQIIQLLSNGATIKDTCAYVGISQDTYFTWCDTKAEFSESTTRARAQSRVAAVAMIRKGIQEGNTDDAKWFLERSDPENWGRQTKILLDYGLTPDKLNPVLRRLVEQGGIAPESLGEAFEEWVNAYLATADADTSSSGES